MLAGHTSRTRQVGSFFGSRGLLTGGQPLGFTGRPWPLAQFQDLRVELPECCRALDSAIEFDRYLDRFVAQQQAHNTTMALHGSDYCVRSACKVFEACRGTVRPRSHRVATGGSSRSRSPSGARRRRDDGCDIGAVLDLVAGDREPNRRGSRRGARKRHRHASLAMANSRFKAVYGQSVHRQ